MRLELLPISLLKSCPFFWACPLVQEEAIPDRKLKYFSSKNPATSACFWRFLGSTGSTRNGAGAGCRARSYESRPPSGVRANGKQPATSPQLPPLLHPSSLVRPVRPEKPPHSPRLWEKAGKAGKEPRPSAGPKKWPSSSRSSRTGRSSGPGNWLKGSFLRHILLSAGLAQDRQEDKQTIRKVLIRRLSFSHFPTVSDLQSPDQGKLRSIRAQCRSIYQDDEACLAIGLVDTHMHCTVHTTTQATQTQSKEEQQIKCICCNRSKH